jgi:predicted enzyme related to lactoylglutathione lyase
MLNFSSILLFTENVEKLNGFYKQVFQKEPDMTDGGYFGYMVGKGFITIGPHDKVKGMNMSPERVMINFETADVKGEFERIKMLGATVIAAPYTMEGYPDMWVATLADPDGNYFQLMVPWEPGKM